MHRICIVLVALAGCTAAFRTQTGGATARDGVAGGTTNSLYFSDRGGILTRAGLVALGVMAAAGSVENVKSTSTVTNNYDGTYTVHTTRTADINTKTLQGATDIINAASDPKQDFGGLTSGLEIASTSLGGNTSGWRYEFGYTYGRPITEHLNFELYACFSFGSFVMHDRMQKTLDIETGVVGMTMGDATYNIVSTPVRVGFPYRLTKTSSVGLVLKVEPNFYLISADEGIDFYPSPWSVGGRLTVLGYVYAELLGSMSAMRSNATSVNLEVGVAF